MLTKNGQNNRSSIKLFHATIICIVLHLFHLFYKRQERNVIRKIKKTPKHDVY